MDLDASYEVIKEAVESVPGLDFTCIRADEIVQTGHIERVMYEYLLKSDLVIADLSTSNVNAFYELGVRCALRPKCTIVVAESKISFPFDINHVPIHTYEHLGDDLGRREAKRFKGMLVELIEKIMASGETDSPVYTFLPGLTAPSIPSTARMEPPRPGPGTSLSDVKKHAAEAMDRCDFEAAIPLWQRARDVGPKDNFVVQQLALATYKAKKPTELEALRKARDILSYLRPHEGLDPETLGLWGAVHKRLYELEGDDEMLTEAITATEKGFVVRGDFYNGINLAFLLDRRAAEASPEIAAEDHARAQGVRRRLVEACSAKLEQTPEMSQTDRYWVLATLQQAAVGLGNEDAAEKWGRQALEQQPASHMVQSSQEQLEKLRALLSEIRAKLG
jgi:tetratricopeptide (TPR) repeat protein